MATNPFDKYLANNLADFAGARISGTLPVKQEVLNDLLQTVLADMATPKTAAAIPAAPITPAASDSAPAFDASRLVQFVKKAQIRVEEGRLVLDFDLRVGE